MAALEGFLRRCCVPLVSDVDGKLALWGTGLFYRRGDTLWLVAAAHILKEVPLKEIAVPMAENGMFQTLGNCTAYSPTLDEKDLDAVAIRIENGEAVAALQQRWHVLDRSSVRWPDADMNRFLVAGFPRETVGRFGGDFGPSFSQFYVDRYSETPDGANPNVDLFMLYGRTAKGTQGEDRETPDLSGMSGTGIWAIAEAVSGVWVPKKQLKLVGVQSSFKHDKFIRGKSWQLVDQIIARAENEERPTAPSST